MKNLLEFLIKGLTNNDNFIVVENTDESRTNFIVKAPKESIGLIIGKGGKTINMIRNLLKVKATLDKKMVSISVEEA